MDANKPHGPNPHGVAAEPDRVPTSVPVALGALLAIAAVAAAVIVALVFFRLEKRADEADRKEIAAAGLERPKESVPPAPRLQIHPVASWNRFREAEAARLTSYGWMDRSSGAVHVPIDRAMELVLERGVGPLPPAPMAVPVPAPTPGAPTPGTAPGSPK